MKTEPNFPILDPDTLIRDGDRWISPKLSIKIDESLSELSQSLRFFNHFNYRYMIERNTDLTNFFPCDKRTAEELITAFNTIRKFVSIPKTFALV